ncbi:hypothetical protein AD006_25155 [Pseudonocardia sp. EC080610-09]|uniref:EthD domain-containing protein n=1 Tax=unclassified Pseudonocardia TaxID=2619320 RepID=UPI0006CB7361|nr:MULTISPECIES: EthD domain-containing protein [unclassified Pseudonocardia]ALE74364.1 hypothetical protein FRP1_17705 [Pseudonocardia sp. EC080625-04]ALL77773.1 hypothetical protein AD006_25155 [Pseudonocardia sp. EC080610-09]ALL80688.1 hypothetical protein AD017_04745 [Pseudonocardia sp. EC080619-01]
MIVLVSLLRRLPELTAAQFTAHHREHHAPLFASVDEVRRLVRRYTVESPAAVGDLAAPQVDAVVRQWFDDVEAIHELLASDGYRTVVLPDERRFIDHASSTFYVTTELDVPITP